MPASRANQGRTQAVLPAQRPTGRRTEANCVGIRRRRGTGTAWVGKRAVLRSIPCRYDGRESATSRHTQKRIVLDAVSRSNAHAGTRRAWMGRSGCQGGAGARPGDDAVQSGSVAMGADGGLVFVYPSHLPSHVPVSHPNLTISAARKNKSRLPLIERSPIPSHPPTFTRTTHAPILFIPQQESSDHLFRRRTHSDPSSPHAPVCLRRRLSREPRSACIPTDPGTLHAATRHAEGERVPPWRIYASQ